MTWRLRSKIEVEISRYSKMVFSHYYLKFGLVVSSLFSLWLILTVVRDYSNSPIDTIQSKILEPKEFEVTPNGSKFEIIYKIAQSSLSPNFVLWNKNQSSVNWTLLVSICKHVLSSDNAASKSVLEFGKKWTLPNPHNNKSIADLLSNCSKFFDRVPFPNVPESNEEAEYPLAYIVMGARNAAQTVRLFRMIYQPQNAYCLVYDNKTSHDYKRVIQNLAKCFLDRNVILTPEPENIEYCRYSILHSELVCLKELLKIWHKIPWKYVQIVSWNDFQLRTNGELVKIFKIFNGSQDSMLATVTPKQFAFRAHPRPLPNGLTLYKGSHATSITKEFVEFVLTNGTVAKLDKWLRKIKCQEEYYWSTIIHNTQLGAPGAFPGECLHYYQYKRTRKPWASRYEAWKWDKGKCKGKIVNYSCAFGFLDLLVLIGRPEFVVHKVYEEYQPLAGFCLEQWYWEKVRNSSISKFDHNYRYYQNFPSVRYQNTKDKEKFEC